MKGGGRWFHTPHLLSSLLWGVEGRADCVLEKPRLKTQTKKSVSPDGQGQIPGPRPSQNRFCRPYQTFRHTQASIPVADDLSCPVVCEWKRSLGVSYMDKWTNMRTAASWRLLLSGVVDREKKVHVLTSSYWKLVFPYVYNTISAKRRWPLALKCSITAKLRYV